MARTRSDIQACARGLWDLPNVVGFGLGRRLARGRDTGEPCITVLVTRKLPLAALALRDQVPRRVEGRLTDVVEVGHLRLLGVDRAARLRPARPGVSVGHFRVTTGTLGAVVYSAPDGEPLILSNNHVLANLADGWNRRGAIGDPILQPGPYDGGRSEDTLARLLRFVPLRPASPSPAWGEGSLLAELTRDSPQNLVDAAVGRPLEPGLIDGRIVELGRVRGTGRPRVGLGVRKSGRTSGVTRGSIRAVEATVSVGMGEVGAAVFSGQILTTPLAHPGDSGSLLVDQRNRAVGLIFAGSNQASVVNDIARVVRLLSITFHPPPA